MGEKEPPFLVVPAPRDVLEGKSQGILQAVPRETNPPGIEVQTELPITKSSLYVGEFVRDTSPTRRSSGSLLAVTSDLHT